MQVSDDVSGSIIEALSIRKGELRDMMTLQVRCVEVCVCGGVVDRGGSGERCQCEGTSTHMHVIPPTLVHSPSSPLPQGGKQRLEFLVPSRPVPYFRAPPSPLPPHPQGRKQRLEFLVPSRPHALMHSCAPSALPQGGKQRLEFLVPSRGMIGFKTVFVNITRGEGIMARSFQGYGRYRGALQGVRKGEQ